MSQFSFDASFWVAVAFFLFVGVLIKVKAPALMARGLDAHAQKVRDELATAANLRLEAEALAAQYAGKLAEAEKDVAELRARTQREIMAMKAEAETNLLDYIDRRTHAAESRIAQAEQAALQDLRTRTSELAIAAAESLLKNQATSPKGADIMNASIKAVQTKLH